MGFYLFVFYKNKGEGDNEFDLGVTLRCSRGNTA